MMAEGLDNGISRLEFKIESLEQSQSMERPRAMALMLNPEMIRYTENDRVQAGSHRHL